LNGPIDRCLTIARRRIRRYRELPLKCVSVKGVSVFGAAQAGEILTQAGLVTPTIAPAIYNKSMRPFIRARKPI